MSRPFPVTAPAALADHIGIRCKNNRTGERLWAFSERQLAQLAEVIYQSARDGQPIGYDKMGRPAAITREDETFHAKA